MTSAVHVQTPAEQIAELHARLRSAEQRAAVAEEQLRRVHEAVREFKQKQMQARAAQVRAQLKAEEAANAAKKTAPSGFYAALADADPTLDDRLDQYLQSDFEPDRARNWMLG